MRWNRGWLSAALAGSLCLGGPPLWAEVTDEKLAQLEAQMRSLQAQVEQLKHERDADRKELAAVKEAKPELLGLEMPQNTGIMVTGYVDLEYKAAENASRTFDNHHFNPIFLGMLGDDLFVQAEIEYEHGGSEVALEYVTLAYFLNDYVTLEGGKFIVPFGEFNERLHPAWINKFLGRPIVFDEVLPGTWSEVGAQVHGAVGLNEFLGTDRPVDAEYTFYLVNGLEGAEGASLRDLTGNHTNNDDNIAAGGRMGLRVLPWGSLGSSWYHGAYTTDGTLDLTMWGLDFAANPIEALELRGEYIITLQEVATPNTKQEDLEKKGWYLQAAYSLNDVANWLSDLPGSQYLGNAEIVTRFSQADLETTSGTNNQHEFGVGFNYYLKPSLVWRLAYEKSQENAGTAKVNDDLVFAQVAYSF
jgi:outer membrane murein-binding lipoprotein Lpp